MAQASTAMLRNAAKGTAAAAESAAPPDNEDEKYDDDHAAEAVVAAARERSSSECGREAQSSYGTTLRSECENEAWTWAVMYLRAIQQQSIAEGCAWVHGPCGALYTSYFVARSDVLAVARSPARGRRSEGGDAIQCNAKKE